jgi:hypothetical protein
MARKIKALGPWVAGVALVATVLIAPLVRSDLPPPPPPNDDPVEEEAVINETAVLACSIRERLGFGPYDVLPALMSNEQHQAVIAAGVEFTQASDAALQALEVSELEAKLAYMEALAWGQDTSTAESQADAVSDDVADTVDAMSDDLAMNVPPESAALVPTVLANMDLDPELRALTLDPGQFEAILAAKAERDRILLNARNWGKPTVLENAHAVYEETLQAALTSEQSAQLEEIRALLAQRLDEIMDLEADAMEIE